MTRGRRRTSRHVAAVAAAAALLLPLAPAGAQDTTKPVPAYDAFGFAAASGGRLFVVARRGVRHQDDPGRLAVFAPDGAPVPAPEPGADDAALYDERAFAGGISPLGCLLTFSSVAVPYGPWVELRRRRTTVPFNPRTRCPTNVDALPSGGDTVFAPYGPLVSLPGGRVLQTFYGWSDAGIPRIRVLSSTDDGVTWDRGVVVDRSTAYRPTEAAMALAGGRGDAGAIIVMVARARWRGNTGVLMQYVSKDGGRHWRNQGIIPVSQSDKEVIPWIAPVGKGRLALVWADRGSLSIKVSIAPAGSVVAGPLSWPSPTEIYRSRLRTVPADQRRLLDFGYPSVASTGPRDTDVFVTFYDSTMALTTDRSAPSGTTIFAVRLRAGVREPIPLTTLA